MGARKNAREGDVFFLGPIYFLAPATQAMNKAEMKLYERSLPALLFLHPSRLHGFAAFSHVLSRPAYSKVNTSTRNLWFSLRLRWCFWFCQMSNLWRHNKTSLTLFPQIVFARSEWVSPNIFAFMFVYVAANLLMMKRSYELFILVVASYF